LCPFQYATPHLKVVKVLKKHFIPSISHHKRAFVSAWLTCYLGWQVSKGKGYLTCLPPAGSAAHNNVTFCLVPI